VPEFRDTEGLPDVTKGVLRNDSILRFAKNEADARLVVGVAKHVIDCGEIEVQLARVFRLELAHFQIDDNEASELQMVEEQIELEVFSSDFKRNLAAYEGEADAEFDEELTQVREQATLQVALVCLGGERQKIEVVWVLDELLGEVGLWLRKCRVEVRDCLPLPAVKAASICRTRTFRLQPLWMACSMYQIRS
jgi:hypothetical protein